MIEARWDNEDDDMVMEVEGGQEEVEPEISLHAMACSQMAKTMKIQG